MIEILQGNSKEVLRDFDKNTFHSCVTDPPYELGFANREWDQTGIAFDQSFWEEVYRVMKPGAHLLSFGGNRTHHRMMVAVEDAGFEIRDVIMWVYGKGWPKSHGLNEEIDRQKGMEDDREVVDTEERYNEPSGMVKAGRGSDAREKVTREITEPASEEAKKWKGWERNLKPAYEPIVLARKPLSEKNVAQNVLKHSAGAINIDGCRIGNEERVNPPASNDEGGNSLNMSKNGMPDDPAPRKTKGRWPANFILDEESAKELDWQSGECYSGSADYGTVSGKESFWGSGEGDFEWEGKGRSATGGASRFFYCTKAHNEERTIGCDENPHATVKPIELTSYLVRLSTPPEEGKVLDPFVGSGTTAIASVLERVDCTGIEMREEKVELSRQRVEYTQNHYQEVYDMIFDDPTNEITNKEKSTIDHNFWD